MPSPIFSQMSPMLGRRALLKASAAMAGVSLAGVVPAYAADETPQYGGTMRAAFYLFAGSLDPVRGVSGGDPYYWRPMFDVLIDADRAQNPRPETSLAESWDLSDPKAVTLQLRKGVLFHDGTPFNAEAVKFNIERILDPATKATPRAAFSAIDRVEVLGEHAVRLHLNRPWGTALSMLSNNGGAMSSPTAVKASGADYLFKPVGTGPFKLAEMVSGSHVRMVRNENYWGRDRAGNRTTLSSRALRGSGGEAQAPFYVAIAASLASAYYPGDRPGDENPGLGLCLLDEAFSKLDVRNSQALVDLYGAWGLQLLIAATEVMDTIVTVYKSADLKAVRIESEHPLEAAKRALAGINPDRQGLEAFEAAQEP